jgi:hypothetical protein
MTKAKPEKDQPGYWALKSSLASDGVIGLFADKVEFTQHSDIIFWRTDANGKDRVVLAVSGGRWSALWSASTSDNAPIEVEAWRGALADEVS